MADSGFRRPGLRPISRRKVWASIAFAIVLIALAFWLWVESVTARKWAEMERAVANLGQEERDADYRRPVLRGEAADGNAWESYSLALERLKASRSVPVTVLAFIEGNPGADRAAVKAALA